MSLHPLNAADTVPDATVFFDRYARESEAARAEFACLRNVAYGPDPMERLDFFPAGPGAPLAIFVHGGYWRRLDKDHFSYIARGLVPHGVSFASIDYGLAPDVTLGTMVDQCRRAVDFLHGNHERFEIDAARISAFGHSAGGHLAAMCGVTFPLHALATISGLHDLLPVRNSFVNEWLGLDDDEARRLSPVSYPPARAFPVYATAGETESADGFKAQGRALVDAWTPYGCAAAYEDSPGDNHFTIMLRLLDPADPLTSRVARLALE